MQVLKNHTGCANHPLTYPESHQKQPHPQVPQTEAERHIHFVLFLCGYFDYGYLEYEAAEGIDWIWEHRANELLDLGL